MGWLDEQEAEGGGWLDHHRKLRRGLKKLVPPHVGVHASYNPIEGPEFEAHNLFNDGRTQSSLSFNKNSTEGALGYNTGTGMYAGAKLNVGSEGPQKVIPSAFIGFANDVNLIREDNAYYGSPYIGGQAQLNLPWSKSNDYNKAPINMYANAHAGFNWKLDPERRAKSPVLQLEAGIEGSPRYKTDNYSGAYNGSGMHPYGRAGLHFTFGKTNTQKQVPGFAEGGVVPGEDESDVVNGGNPPQLLPNNYKVDFKTAESTQKTTEPPAQYTWSSLSTPQSLDNLQTGNYNVTETPQQEPFISNKQRIDQYQQQIVNDPNLTIDNLNKTILDAYHLKYKVDDSQSLLFKNTFAHYNPLTRTITRTPNEYNKSINQSILPSDSLSAILAELPHVIQQDSLGTIGLSKWAVTDFIKNGYNKELYETLGTMENNAHSQIEPYIKSLNDIPNWEQDYQFNYDTKSDTYYKDVNYKAKQHRNGGTIPQFEEGGVVDPDQTLGPIIRWKDTYLEQPNNFTDWQKKYINPDPLKDQPDSEGVLSMNLDSPPAFRDGTDGYIDLMQPGNSSVDAISEQPNKEIIPMSQRISDLLSDKLKPNREWQDVVTERYFLPWKPYELPDGSNSIFRKNTTAPIDHTIEDVLHNRYGSQLNTTAESGYTGGLLSDDENKKINYRGYSIAYPNIDYGFGPDPKPEVGPVVSPNVVNNPQNPAYLTNWKTGEMNDGTFRPDLIKPKFEKGGVVGPGKGWLDTLMGMQQPQPTKTTGTPISAEEQAKIQGWLDKMNPSPEITLPKDSQGIIASNDATSVVKPVDKFDAPQPIPTMYQLPSGEVVNVQPSVVYDTDKKFDGTKDYFGDPSVGAMISNGLANMNQIPVGRTINDIIEAGFIGDLGIGAIGLGYKGARKIPGLINDFGESVAPNAWKLNPKAYQYNLPENTMWRGLGKEGMEDAVSSGLFRSKQNVEGVKIPNTNFTISKSFGINPYFTPKFKTAATYGDNFLAEVPRDAANWRNRYGRGKTWSQVADRPIPIDEGRILQKDWLQGYKQVGKESSKLTDDEFFKLAQTNVNKKATISNNIKATSNQLPKGNLTEDEIKLVNNAYNKAIAENLPYNDTYGIYNLHYSMINNATSSKLREQYNNLVYGLNNKTIGETIGDVATLFGKGVVAGTVGAVTDVAASVFLPTVVKQKVIQTLGFDPFMPQSQSGRRRGPRNSGYITNDTIISLDDRLMSYARINETTSGNTILGGEFIENSNNSVRTAKDWLAAKEDDVYGDKELATKDIKNFYGVEDSKFKVGSAKEFNENTQLVPIRFDNNISKAFNNNGKLRLLDSNNERIYNNVSNGGKFILYSPTTKKSIFVSNNKTEKGVNIINSFIFKNGDAKFIHLDNGRYRPYLVNKSGLKEQDFKDYYELDWRRKGNPGYNLILK